MIGTQGMTTCKIWNQMISVHVLDSDGEHFLEEEK